MRTSRRKFLELGCHAAVGGILVSTARSLIPGSGTDSVSAQGNASYDNYDPRAHSWAFVVDTTKCIGCGRCARACKLENNVPWEPSCNRTWIERYRFTEREEVFVDSPAGGINGFPQEPVPEGKGFRIEQPTGAHGTTTSEAGNDENAVVKAFFVPKLCNQCDNPPCVQVCPVGATYKTKDGITLVDQKKCIGCRYCIQACPYGARYLVPGGDRKPMGQAHVADKCTWCYHRITRGLKPACVEACPVGARQFGDLKREGDPIIPLLKENRVDALKPDLGTRPKVKYIGLDEAVV